MNNMYNYSITDYQDFDSAQQNCYKSDTNLNL